MNLSVAFTSTLGPGHPLGPHQAAQGAASQASVHAIDLDPLVLKAAETVGSMPAAVSGTERWGEVIETWR